MGKFAVIVEKAAQKELLAHYKSGDKSSIKRIVEKEICISFRR